MKFFYLSSIDSPDGAYYVHERDCPVIPDPIDRDYLGPFNNADEALRKALKINPNSKKCEHCCVRNTTSMMLQNTEVE
ncbi:hypothetical protein ACFSKL_15415 [Belliella marina]|uniref:Uncharacterized protein n=1 Tax=Belliella marina TaxID=1644146 RepID=A0ABW4VR92_9BACT